MKTNFKEQRNGIFYYLKKIQDSIEQEGPLIFRGHQDCSYDLQSSAKRRLSKSLNSYEKNRFVTEKDFVKYHLDILENTSAVDLEKEEQNLRNIDLLAQIQHYGGATFLADFTKNILVALWFASKKCTNKCRKKKDLKPCCSDSDDKCNSSSTDKNGDCDCRGGRVYVVNLKENKKSISTYRRKYKKRQDEKIEELLFYAKRTEEKEINPHIWYWEPEKKHRRMRAQSSVFLFGLPSFEQSIKYKSIVILEKDKELIREELKVLFNITAETLFPDLQGYSQIVNGQDQKYSISTCFLSGRECLENAQYETAIAHFTHAILCLEKGVSCHNNTNAVDIIPKACDKTIIDECHYYLGKTYLDFWKENPINQNNFTYIHKAIIELKKTISSSTELKIINKAQKKLIECLYIIKDYSRAFYYCEELLKNNENNLFYWFVKLELSTFSDKEKDIKEENDNLETKEELGRLKRVNQSSSAHIDFMLLFFQIIGEIKSYIQDPIKLEIVYQSLDNDISKIVKKWKEDKKAIFDGRIYWNFDNAKSWIQDDVKYPTTTKRALEIVIRFEMEQNQMISNWLLQCQKN